MHPEAERWVRRCVSLIPPPDVVVEFGSRDVNGGVRGLFAAATFVGVDSAPGRGVDVVSDAADYSTDLVVDVVVSTEVLEHTERAGEVVANALRILRPGGFLILTCAGPGRAPHSAIDEQPIRPWEHYSNITVDDLTGWLAEAVDVEIDVLGSDVRAFARRPWE